MEKITAHLNIISNFIMINQILKINHAQLVNNVLDENNSQEIN